MTNRQDFFDALENCIASAPNSAQEKLHNAYQKWAKNIGVPQGQESSFLDALFDALFDSIEEGLMHWEMEKHYKTEPEQTR